MSIRSIYFCASIRGGLQDAELYADIVKYLKKFGNVFTEHGGNSDIEAEERSLTDKFIHDRDVTLLESSDVVVAEVTQPSLGVGYEIGRAVKIKKPILCLFRPSSGKKLSAMIRGAHNGEDFQVRDYEKPDFPDILEEYFKALKKP